LLAEAAIAVARTTGFENIGLPLCATVEAEAFGSLIAPADASTEPRVARERYQTLDEASAVDVDSALDAGRIPALLEAVAIASEEAEDLPVIANVLGPVTLAASLLEPTTVLRAMLESPDQLRHFLSKLVQFQETLIGRLAVMGADVIAIHEDVGTPRAIGPRLFEKFTAQYLRTLLSSLRGASEPVVAAGHVPFCVCPACRVTTAMHGMRRDIPVVIHCCELSKSVWPILPTIGANAWSIGHATSIRLLRAALPDLILIGNTSTQILDRGSATDASRLASMCIQSGVNILCPACGLGMSTPLANIRSFSDAVRSNRSPVMHLEPADKEY
jgi:[methyl-Co(III) methanol-specific corrinoid protein]:coenzyme M methyltransferase